MLNKLLSMKKLLTRITVLAMLSLMLVGVAKPANAAPVTGKFYWVQNTAWHPVHQLTQLSFLLGCTEQKLDCALATTDDTSLEALIAVGLQTVARPDVKGIAVWCCGLPQLKPVVEAAKAKGIPVAMLHGPTPEGSFPDNMVVIAADTTKYPDPIAKAMCDQLKDKTGTVAITQNNYNPTEDMVAKVFAEGMKKYCPNLKVLAPELEGPEPTKAIAVAVSIMQANPDIVAGFSTTGGGPTTWAGAQKETGVKIVAVGMDYTRVNLDLVKSGQIYGVVAQPLYEESYAAGVILSKMASGEKVPYWSVLEAPLVTKDNLDAYYKILDNFEPNMRPTPTTVPATPTK
jgi:ribose transport system substrate-binding protein